MSLRMVREIAQEEVERNLSDIATAITRTLKRIKGLSNYHEIVELLLYISVQEVVYDIRHALGVIAKRQANCYGSGPSILPTAEALKNVGSIYRSVFDIPIDGTVLGDLTGNDLDRLIERERAMENGHRFNRELLTYLRRDVGVKDEQRVRDTIEEKVLRKRFDRIYRKVFGKKSGIG